MIIGYRRGKNMPRSRRGFKSPRSPTAIKIQSTNGRLTDDWASIWACINNASPMSIEPHSTDDWKHLDNRRNGALYDGK